MEKISSIEKRIKIVGISGSTGKHSTTRIALEKVLEGAEKCGACIELIDLGNYNLPFVGSVDEDFYSEDVFILRSAIKNADGLVLATPEYYGSMSGLLKNAIDLSGYGDFNNKPVALVGIAGGEAGAINSLNALRTISRNLHAFALPQEVSVASAKKVIDDDGNIVDVNILKRLTDLGSQLAEFSALMKLYRNGSLSGHIHDLLSNRSSIVSGGELLRKAG